MEQAKVGGRTNHRLEWALIAVWALLALLLDLLWIDLYDRFWVIAFVLPATLWLGIAGLAGSIAVRAFRDRAWAAPMILLAALASVGTLQGLAGERIGLLARFHTLRPRYRAIVADIQAGRVPPGGTRYLIEQGIPLRVAFPWPGGITDNWCGVVYDPSGLVLKARLFRPDLSNFGDPALRQVRSLFGGDLRSCEPLGGHWYFCCFT
jgi:hypothetical protein